MQPNESLGDRMKYYEGLEAQRKLFPLLPALVRLDGKNFSSLTRNLNKPYDPQFSQGMIEVTRYLSEETNPLIAYTQSDEITLVYYHSDFGQAYYYDGRIQKMISVMAAMASVYFYEYLKGVLPSLASRYPVFDCRAWNVPSKEEAANALLWRERDATKNSITMAAASVYSHKQLFEKSGSEKQAMLLAKDINWNDYPAFFKRGTFVQRKKELQRFTVEELERLPPQHEARVNPNLEIERTSVCTLAMPPFGRVTNRTGVIFKAEEPQVDDD